MHGGKDELRHFECTNIEPKCRHFFVLLLTLMVGLSRALNLGPSRNGSYLVPFSTKKIHVIHIWQKQDVNNTGSLSAKILSMDIAFCPHNHKTRIYSFLKMEKKAFVCYGLYLSYFSDSTAKILQT